MSWISTSNRFFGRRLHDPRRRQQKLNAATVAESSHWRPENGANQLQLRQHAEPFDEDAEIYQALVLGTRDYVQKNGFKKVVLG